MERFGAESSSLQRGLLVSIRGREQRLNWRWPTGWLAGWQLSLLPRPRPSPNFVTRAQKTRGVRVGAGSEVYDKRAHQQKSSGAAKNIKVDLFHPVCVCV